jgi:hypothetical protein
MRFVGINLMEMAARLPCRARRPLIVVGAALMMLFAGTTAKAANCGRYADATAGAAMLGVAVLVCATGWSVRRR